MTTTDREENPESRPKFRFDPTVNLGHLLTFAGFVSLGLGAYSNLDKRVLILEEGRKAQALTDQAQDLRYDTGLRNIQHQLDRIERKLEEKY